MFDLAAHSTPNWRHPLRRQAAFLPTSPALPTPDAVAAAARSGAARLGVFQRRANPAAAVAITLDSAAGEGLYVSVLLRPQIPAVRLAFLPLAAGLAAADAIRAVSRPRCRSPLAQRSLIGERKAGGILVEAGNDSKGPPYAVVGIGINVHQRAFPPDLATPATSLDLETAVTSARQALLRRAAKIAAAGSSRVGESGRG
jgi:BirA family biotin operon repressor/biotin-[acetyl-CoA-carboxylase] ligase